MSRWQDVASSRNQLKRDAVRGSVATFIAQAIKFVLNIGVTIVLAHLLLPEDFGVVAMVMIVVNFFALFKDAGFSMATVQQKQVNHAQVSLLFWLNVVLGVVLGVVLYISAPLWVWLFHEQRLGDVVHALAWVFLLGGLGVQHEALMRRSMDFKRLMWVDVLSLLLASMLALLLAWEGWGYWAMVWMQVAAIGVRVGLVWVWSGWLPSWPVFKVGVRRMVAFGGSLTLANSVQYLARQSDQVLLGWSAGTHALGLYSTAMNMLMLPIRQVLAPLTQVALVTLSRVQSNPDDFRRVYLLLLRWVGYASMPLMAVLVALAEPVVYVFLGAQWLAAVPIVRILAAAGWILAVNNTMGWIFTARGQGGRMLRWNMMMAPLWVLAFSCGLAWDAEGVAWGFLIVIYVSRYAHFRYTLHGSSIAVKDMMIALLWPACLSVVLAGLASLMAGIWVGYSEIVALGGTMMFLFLLCVLVVRFFVPIRKEVHEMWCLLQEVRR